MPHWTISPWTMVMLTGGILEVLFWKKVSYLRSVLFKGRIASKLLRIAFCLPALNPRRCYSIFFFLKDLIQSNKQGRGSMEGATRTLNLSFIFTERWESRSPSVPPSGIKMFIPSLQTDEPWLHFMAEKIPVLQIFTTMSICLSRCVCVHVHIHVNCPATLCVSPAFQLVVETSTHSFSFRSCIIYKSVIRLHLSPFSSITHPGRRALRLRWS